MNIVTQTTKLPNRLGLLLCLFVTMNSFCPTVLAESGDGQILCQVTRNGAKARGTVVLQQNSHDIAHGACSATLTAPAGRYRAVVRLEGNLDHPHKTLSVQIEAGRRLPIEVDFRTGALLVRVVPRGATGPAVIAVYRGKERIGTLSNGVEAQLSEGEYQLVVEQAGQKKTQTVDLRAGQKRMIRVEI